MIHFDDLPVPDFNGFGLRTTPCSPVENRRWVARLVDVYDGDTLTCVVRLDCGEYQRVTVRLLGVDACELKASNPAVRQLAVRARDRAVEHLSRPWMTAPLASLTQRSALQDALDRSTCLVGLDVRGRDKYGRFLGHVYPLGGSSRPPQSTTKLEPLESLGDLLLREGLAYSYSGGQRLTEDEELDLLLHHVNAPQ